MSTKRKKTKRKPPQLYLFIDDSYLSDSEEMWKGPFKSIVEVRKYCLSYIIDELDGDGDDVSFMVHKKPVAKFVVEGDTTNFQLKEISTSV